MPAVIRHLVFRDETDSNEEIASHRFPEVPWAVICTQSARSPRGGRCGSRAYKMHMVQAPAGWPKALRSRTHTRWAFPHTTLGISALSHTALGFSLHSRCDRPIGTTAERVIDAIIAVVLRRYGACPAHVLASVRIYVQQ